MIAALLTLMRSLIWVKLGLVVLFLIAAFVKQKRITFERPILFFYLFTALAGTVWSIVGLVRHGNYAQGNFDAVRLYVLWSIAFCLLYSRLRSLESPLVVFHKAIVLAGILVPLINFVTLYNPSLIPESLRTEMAIEIGYGEGYLAFASANIISMFVIAPYLIALQFRKDSGQLNNWTAKLSLLLSLALVVISGRRALWFIVALTPCLVWILARLTKAQTKRWLTVCYVACILAFGSLLIWAQPDAPLAERIKSAFSAEDERSLQEPYLVSGFLEYPLMGSGFGGYAGYRRSLDQPWMYELTYQKMLFNMGMIGTGIMAALFAAYFWFALRLLRRQSANSVIPFALLIALCSLLIGAYSNPYLGGFDSLFFVGLLPYIATFRNGFS